MDSFNLSFELPTFRQVKTETVSRLLAASTELQKSSRDWRIIQPRHVELATQINHTEGLNAQTATIEEINIGNTYESSIFHVDNRNEDGSSQKDRISLLSTEYATIFASCRMILFESCVELLNAGIEKEIKSEDILSYTFEDLSPKSDASGDVLFELFRFFTENHGKNWLESFADRNNHPMSNYIKVSNLAIVQSMPYVLAIGDTHKTLHRTPDDPSTSYRLVFQSFSAE